MSDLRTEIISGIIGAVAGGIAGAFAGWVIAPTQAEREERGKQRVQGRQQIANAISNLRYQLTAARGNLFRMEAIGDGISRETFLGFAGDIRAGALTLPRLERWKIQRRARILTGKLIWRLAAIVPPGHYSDVDEASVLKATADTRTSNETATLSISLLRHRPTDPEWDAALKAVDKLAKAYPG
jgi:hypothetical protein